MSPILALPALACAASLSLAAATAVAAPDAPNAAPTVSASGQVLVVTKVKRPWYAADFLLHRGFRKSVPEYAALPGLITKFYSIAEDGRFGGVYLWTDRASAERQFDARWHARVQSTYCAPGEVRLYEVVTVLDRRPAAERTAATHEEGEAVITLLDAATSDALADSTDGLRWRAQLRDASGKRVDAVLWTQAPTAAAALADARQGRGLTAGSSGDDGSGAAGPCVKVRGQCAVEYFQVPLTVLGSQPVVNSGPQR
jgi:opacity protein-like surface antigen